jgi:hypothetical protein
MKINVFIRIKQINLDGRYIILLSLSIYFLILFIANFFSTYHDFWNLIGVPARPYPFGDLRVITSGLECYQQGYDVYVNNPCNPWPFFGEFNYPQIWLSLTRLGINQSHTLLLGVSIVLLFFIAVFLTIGRLKISEGCIYSFILCSPSVMLGIERANNDLIIFIILAIALFLMRYTRYICHLSAYLLLFFASCLKLYPMFSLLITFREGKKRFLLTNSLFLSLFVIYLVSQFENIKQVSSATPQVNYWSYGFKIIFHVLRSDLIKFVDVIGIDKNTLHYWVSSTGVWQKFSLQILFFITIFLGAFLIVVTVLKRIKPCSLQISSRPELPDALRIGASIYVGTFLLGNNWAYRLIFLIFTIPQILYWLRTHQLIATISQFALVGLILTLWLKTLSFGGWMVYVGQAIDWFLFMYFLYVLALTLPDWVKRLIPCRNRAVSF